MEETFSCSMIDSTSQSTGAGR